MLGAFFGSFLNMVIYRLPRGKSFNEPKRSFCPNCEHSLDWIDLIPLVSWASTGGKCRYCKEPIAARYEIVELLNALLFGGVWWRFMTGTPNPDWISFAAYSAEICALVAIIFIDAELFIIPDELNAFLLIVALAFAGFTGHIILALQGALLGWGLLWGIAFLGRLGFGKDAMGDGDIKMMRGVGALLGPLLVVADVGIAVVLGIVGGVAGMILAKRNQPAREQAEPQDMLPYEPTPIWVVIVCGAWYLCCLDVVALFIKPLDKWISSRLPQEITEEEEDDWRPTSTTIPFGPYLAAGAIACILAGPYIVKIILEYWKRQTGM
jgi:leader peptidase (prepilin peptidase)/N-methyltransferase